VLNLEQMLRVVKLESTYKDSPKYREPVCIGYLKIDQKTGEVKTYAPDGTEDKPIGIEE
jgi:hypothetical protein